MRGSVRVCFVTGPGWNLALEAERDGRTGLTQDIILLEGHPLRAVFSFCSLGGSLEQPT